MPSAVRNRGGELWQIQLPGYLQLSQRWNIPRRVYQGREKISMQQQEEGSNNCGLFSIAAAYHAAKRDNIAAITFNENRMRSHLVHCFEHQKFTAFPKSRKIGKASRPQLQHICISIYCPCQRPDSFDEMILCDKCDTWYHFKCAKVKEDPLEDWFCSSCRQLKQIISIAHKNIRNF